MDNAAAVLEETFHNIRLLAYKVDGKYKIRCLCNSVAHTSVRDDN